MIKIIILILWFLPLSGHVNQSSRACFKDVCFDLELAFTSEEQKQGLMFREKLEKNKGMLFYFPEEKEYAVWMKNTLIPLDILWINKNKEIVFMKKNVQPCKIENCPIITPRAKAKYVLEINQGMIDEKGLKEGDKVILKKIFNLFKFQ